MIDAPQHQRGGPTLAPSGTGSRYPRHADPVRLPPTAQPLRRRERLAMTARPLTTVPHYPPGIEISAPVTAEYAEVLGPDALAFAAKLQRAFGGRRSELLARRAARQREFDAGKLPDFPAETRAVREGNWTCASIPDDIVDRRVEITGPVDRKMIVNALNSGASVFMADFEDANTPKWDNNIQGHLNLRDAIRRRIDYASPDGKAYKLDDRTAVLF